MPFEKDKQQFVFDYRPIILTYAIYCIWQGLGWTTDPEQRYSAQAFHFLKRWSHWVGQDVQAWGVPMLLAGLLILMGMIAQVWQVRWMGYAISSITFLALAESIRQSGELFPDASQSGFRTYVFVGVLPIVLATIAFVHAHERRTGKRGP